MKLIKIFILLTFTLQACKSEKSSNSSKDSKLTPEIIEQKDIILKTSKFKLNEYNEGIDSRPWGELTIEYLKNDIINFKIVVNNQSGCLSEIEGKTVIKNRIATYKESENDKLIMKFIETKKEIIKVEIIEEGFNYKHGEGCTFYGTYRKK